MKLKKSKRFNTVESYASCSCLNTTCSCTCACNPNQSNSTSSFTTTGQREFDKIHFDHYSSYMLG